MLYTTFVCSLSCLEVTLTDHAQVENFLFYVLTEGLPSKDYIMGFFSKVLCTSLGERIARLTCHRLGEEKLRLLQSSLHRHFTSVSKQRICSSDD